MENVPWFHLEICVVPPLPSHGPNHAGMVLDYSCPVVWVDSIHVATPPPPRHHSPQPPHPSLPASVCSSVKMNYSLIFGHFKLEMTHFPGSNYHLDQFSHTFTTLFLINSYYSIHSFSAN